jgi:hypothetical protein
MDVKAKWVSADPEQEIRPRGDDLHESCFSWKNGSVQTPRAADRGRHEQCHVRIATDDSVEDHDVSGLYVGGERHEVASQKLHASGVTPANDFFGSEAQLSLRGVDVNR